MRTNRLFYYLAVLAATAVLIGSSQALAANYPLEIIQPRVGLDTKNRFYKAYPGLEYNVRMAVIGGGYPFTYSLATAPSGMTINSSTGTITWPNPTTNGSPHTVTATVTDLEGTSANVTWTITVTTSGFIFVDAVNGTHAAGYGCTTSCGTGTIANPFKSFIDWYEGSDAGAKSRSSYVNNFIYFRTGVYTMDAYLENSATRLAVLGEYKPLVWLAYPGDTPVIDFQSRSTGPHIIFYSKHNNVYIDGLELKNMSQYGFAADSNADHVTFRRLYMHGLGPTSGFNNQSFIDLRTAGVLGNYWVIQDSTFDDLDHGATIKIYQLNKLLIENNRISNQQDSLNTGAIEGIALKQDVVRPTIRGNTIHDVPARAIGGNMHSQVFTSFGYEILFNNIYNASGNAIELNQNGSVGVIYTYRNTFQGRVALLNSTSTTGPFYFSNNVIVNNDNTTDHIVCGGGNVGGCSDPARSIMSSNLPGFFSNNIVDSIGTLTSAYSSYLGKAGYQINGNAPSPPRNVAVQ